MSEGFPWDPEPEPPNHNDFYEVMEEAFKEWHQRNPRKVPDRLVFTYKQLLSLLVKTNEQQIDKYILKALETRDTDG